MSYPLSIPPFRSSADGFRLENQRNKDLIAIKKPEPLVTESDINVLKSAWDHYDDVAEGRAAFFEGFSQLDQAIIALAEKTYFHSNIYRVDRDSLKKREEFSKLCNATYIRDLTKAIDAKIDEMISRYSNIKLNLVEPDSSTTDSEGLYSGVAIRAENAEKILKKSYEYPFLRDIPKIKLLASRSIRSAYSTKNDAFLVIAGWIGKIPQEHDRQIALKAFESFKIAVNQFPQIYGFFRGNLEYYLDWFVENVWTDESRTLAKEDNALLKQTGLSEEFIKISDAIPTAKDLEGLYEKIKAPEYHQELDKLIGRCEVIERKLASHLLNPEVAAIYSSICALHFRCISAKGKKYSSEHLKTKAYLWSKYSVEKLGPSKQGLLIKKT